MKLCGLRCHNTEMEITLKSVSIKVTYIGIYKPNYEVHTFKMKAENT